MNLIKFLIFLRRELLKEFPNNVIIGPLEENKPKELQVVAYPLPNDRDVKDFSNKESKRAA